MNKAADSSISERARIRAIRKQRRQARQKKRGEHFSDGSYWQNRMDMMYYHNVEFIMRTVARDARSMIDVGTANCPYQEWFDWIPERISFDRVPPYSSKNVTGIQGDFLTHDFERRFDVATCLQVLEHIPDPVPFARRLLEISDLVIISAPYKWPAGMVDDHVNDPMDQSTLDGWMERRANFSMIIEEPFRARRRFISIYATDRNLGWGKKDVRQRIIRNRVLES